MIILDIMTITITRGNHKHYCADSSSRVTVPKTLQFEAKLIIGVGISSGRRNDIQHYDFSFPITRDELQNDSCSHSPSPP